MILEDVAPYQAPLDRTIAQVATMAHKFNYKSGLIRGSEDKGPLAQIRIRQDRTPRDSTMTGTVMFNYWIEQKLGIPNIRFRTMYATSAYNLAADYGDTIYCLMLTDEATIVYNPNLSDSLRLLQQIDRAITEICPEALQVTLTTADTAQASIQKMMDVMSPEQVTAFKAYLDAPPKQIADYVQTKGGSIRAVPEGMKSPEYMILGVESVWGFNANMLHDWDPEIRGSDYADTFQYLVDEALKKQ